MASKRQARTASKSGRKFPWRTLLAVVLLLGLAYALYEILRPKDTGSTVIAGCEFPPNPYFSSKVDLEASIQKNLGFFKGTGEPVVIDNLSSDARREQLRTSILCSVQAMYPNESANSHTCMLKTLFLPVNPSENLLKDAQLYCLAGSDEGGAILREEYKYQRGILGGLQALLRKDPQTGFILTLDPADASELERFWVRRTAVSGDYADLLQKICDDPENACLDCSIRRPEKRATIGLKGSLQSCIHPSGGTFMRCQGQTGAPEGGSLPSCTP